MFQLLPQQKQHLQAARTQPRSAAFGGLVVCLSIGCARFGYDQVSHLDNVGDTGVGGAGGLGGAGGAGGAGGIELAVDASSGGQPFQEVDSSATTSDTGFANAPGTDTGTVPTLPIDSGSPEADATPPLVAPAICSFGNPELLGDPNFDGNALFGPTLSNDGLSLFVAFIVPGVDEQIGLSTRTDRNLTFGLANPLPPPVNQAKNGTPHLLANDRILYFHSERGGGAGSRDLYRATRPNSSSEFNNVSILSELNTPNLDYGPWVSSNDLRIYYVSDRNGGSQNIWFASRPNSGASFSSPNLVSELNSSEDDGRMALTEDELVIIFGSRRPGTGGYDLYRASRARIEDPFSAPQLLAGVNSAQDELDPTLSKDGQELFFSSTRNGETALWRSLRTCN